MRFGLNKISHGMEISVNAISMVRVAREKSGWRLLKGATLQLPPETLSLSYHHNNITDMQTFTEVVQSALDSVGGKVGRIGISIPNEIVKVSIQKFDALPASEKMTEKMIAWNTEKTLHFAADTTRISYQRLNAENQLFVTIAVRDTIREYETALRTMKLEPEVVRPAGINQYNYYNDVLPGSGIIAFLGLYENYFTFFVFEEGALTFYHGVKRGFSDLHFFQDVDMTMQHYLNINPDKEIESLFVGSQVAFHRELEEVFRNLSDMDVEIIDESKLIQTELGVRNEKDRERLSALSSAIGAAQSIWGW